MLAISILAGVIRLFWLVVDILLLLSLILELVLLRFLRLFLWLGGLFSRRHWFSRLNGVSWLNRFSYWLSWFNFGWLSSRLDNWGNLGALLVKELPLQLFQLSRVQVFVADVKFEAL